MSPRNLELNMRSSKELINLANSGKISMLMDRGLALSAAKSGVPINGLGWAANLLFMACLIGSPIVLILKGWEWAGASLVVSFASFKFAKNQIAVSVRKQALKNPDLLDVLMRHGTIRFHHSDNEGSNLFADEYWNPSEVNSPLSQSRPTLKNVFDNFTHQLEQKTPLIVSPYTHNILGIPPFDVPDEVVERDCKLRALNAAFALGFNIFNQHKIRPNSEITLELMKLYADHYATIRVDECLVRRGFLTSAQNEEILARVDRARSQLTHEIEVGFSEDSHLPLLSMFRYLVHDGAADPNKMNSKFGLETTNAMEQFSLIAKAEQRDSTNE